MTDQLVNDLKLAIGKRKSDIGLIRDQLKRISPELGIINQQVGNFYIHKNNVHPDGEFTIVHDPTATTVCFINVFGDYPQARMEDLDCWFDNFDRAISQYIANLDAERKRKEFENLLYEARSLGIDTTPYEADLAESVGEEKPEPMMAWNGVDQI